MVHRASEDKKIPGRMGRFRPLKNYFAGMARNQISKPNKISALNSENAVCSG